MIGLTFKTQQVYVIQPNEGSDGINHWVLLEYEEIATWTKDLAFKNSTFGGTFSLTLLLLGSL